MSEFNWSKCSKPFGTSDEAKKFMVERGYEGEVLQRSDGTYLAVCPAYPEGYYPDASTVEKITKEQ